MRTADVQINVFELGATYLRLRSALMLKDPMPEVDPAIYNIRFAHRLDFKSQDVNRIAQDATRLIRRFKADWMTQGRRPAGVCGACMVIAARMSGYLRTCEEVAQVVRVSPGTVRKRLMEFAQTQMATKTVQEWREIPDEQLGEMDDEAEPPVVRENRRKAELAEARARAVATRVEAVEDEEGDDQAQSGSGREDGDGRPAKKRRTGKEKAPDESGAPATPPAATDDDEQIIDALQAAANELETYEATGDDDGDDDDVGLPEMERVDFIDDLNRAGDDPEEVARQNKIEARAYKRSLKVLNADDPEDLQESEFEDDDEEYGDDDAAEGEQAGGPVAPKKIEFNDWDDEEKMYKYIGETYFKDEINLFKLTDVEVKARVSQWIAGRDPKQICGELALVEKARKERERFSKRKPETHFPDVDDAELEGYYKLEPHELRMRTRVWLSNNGRWLEEDKGEWASGQASTVLMSREAGQASGVQPGAQHRPEQAQGASRCRSVKAWTDGQKQKKKRAVQKGPYNSAREAIETFASTKKFSSRFNYGALSKLGLGDDEKDDEDGLETLDDDYGVGFDEKATFKEDDKVDDGELGFARTNPSS